MKKYNQQRQEKLERQVQLLEKLFKAQKSGSTLINRGTLIKELYYLQLDLDTTTKHDSIGIRETREETPDEPYLEIRIGLDLNNAKVEGKTNGFLKWGNHSIVL